MELAEAREGDTRLVYPHVCDTIVQTAFLDRFRFFYSRIQTLEGRGSGAGASASVSLWTLRLKSLRGECYSSIYGLLMHTIPNRRRIAAS